MYQNSNKNLLFKVLASFSTPHFTKTLRITSGRQNRAQVWSWNLMLWNEIDQINSEHFKAELNWICLIGISVFLVVSDDLNWCRLSLKNYLTITKKHESLKLTRFLSDKIFWREMLLFREHLSSPDTFMVGGASGEVDLAVMANCHASIIGGGCLVYFAWIWLWSSSLLL